LSWTDGALVASCARAGIANDATNDAISVRACGDAAIGARVEEVNMLRSLAMLEARREALA
jgi:hypothetical protein